MSELRAVFFDLDDTLCDTIGTRAERARRAVALLCAAQPDADAESLFERAMEPVQERTVRGIPGLLEELSLTDTPEGRQALAIWFFDGCADLLRPLEAVRETVVELAGRYVLGVITNGDAGLQRAKFDQMGFDIHHLVISGECGYEKPDPRIFWRATAGAGVQPAEAVFVGDRLDVDIAGAKAAGMRAVWFNHWNGVLDGAAAPDAVIKRFDELPGVLSGL